ncbi:hypothetical protein EGI20_00855 [Aquitalea sp. S1-19]|nr:hypothetical protein [Aquitalea sp. S1-19]
MVDVYSVANLKRNAAHFLAGKTISAGLTFFLLLLLVRKLELIEYGVYVTFVAAMELLLSFSDVGLHALGIRFLPEFMLKASGKRLSLLVARQVGCYAGMATLVALLMLAVLQFSGVDFGLGSHLAAAKVYLLVGVIEGTARLLRDQTLSSMMMQSLVRVSLVSRLSVLVGGILLLDTIGNLDLMQVVLLELFASLAGLLVSSVGLVRFLLTLRSRAQAAEWHEPKWWDMWRSSFRLYTSMLVSMLYGETVFILLVKRFLGLEAVAVFGFILNLISQIRRYLPVTMFFSLIQPKLVAAYANTTDCSSLFRNVNIASKLNLFFLLPLLALVATHSSELLFTISGGKFTGDGYLLASCMLMLVPLSQRALLEVMAQILTEERFCVRAALSGLWVVPLSMFLFFWGLGIWAAIIPMVIGQAIFAVYIIFQLRIKYAYPLDVHGGVRLIFSFMCALILGWILPVGQGIFEIGIISLLVFCGFLFVAWLCKPFSREENVMINDLFKFRVFVW